MDTLTNLVLIIYEEYVHPEDEELYTEDEYDEEYEYNADTEYYQGQYESYEEQSQQILFSCEACDRDFYTKNQFDKHMSEHRTCKLDGCKFTAHEKIVEKHILMQHATGLYDKIRNINTPEEIAKWVEERKKRYPSKENILKRQEKQEQMLKRGERIKKNENRFGKDKFRLRKNDTKKPPPIKKSKRPFMKEPKPVSLINEKIDWNGTMYPFKGTSTLDSESEKEVSDFEDDEWSSAPAKPVEIKLNNALGALMGAYMSGDETDEEICVDKKPEETKELVKKIDVAVNKDVNVQHGDSFSQTNLEKMNEDSDVEPPIEVKIQKGELAEIVPKKEESQMPNISRNRKRKRPISKFNKKLPFKNQSRKFVKGKFRNKNGTRTKRDHFPYSFRKRKVTLLEKLLESEIRHERNVLLQCIRYTVENNFFRDHAST